MRCSALRITRKVNWAARVQSALDLIDEAVEVYSVPGREVNQVYASFSGGHDSLAATSITSEHPLFRGVVHWNTGIGIEQTREFVREVCRSHGWPLFEVRALEDCGQDYEDLVLETGFPGPGLHYKMWHRLKERCCRHFMKHHAIGPDRIIFASGRRSKESERRKQSVHRHDRTDRRVMVSVIHDWTALDVTEYIASRSDLERNPVSDLLHMSGECLCGAYATRGELQQVEEWFPEVGERIRRLEAKVREAGFDWGWEEGPPGARQAEPDPDQMELPFCSGCPAKWGHETPDPVVERFR